MYKKFKNPFELDFGALSLILNPILIDDSTCTPKRSLHDSDLLTATIYVSPYKSINTLTSTCYYSPINVPNSETIAMWHTIIRDIYDYNKPIRGYWTSFHDRIIL